MPLLLEVKMQSQVIDYEIDGKTFKGYIAYDSASALKRPAVLVAPAWRGLDDFAREKARQLAALGYVGFAVDLYGDGVEADSDERASELMRPLFLDRQLLRRRIVAGYETLCRQPFVDTAQIAAIGFCFGGLTVIELLRGGSLLRATVSFHGILGNTLGSLKAKTVQAAKEIKGALLLLHGHDDPLVSKEDIAAIQEEFTSAGVDWQMHIYGHTAHAFTNPVANDHHNGLFYNSKAAHRSWQAMVNLLQETLSV